MTGLLVIMGSGETAPTMVKPHRAIFARIGDRPAVVLDTPYGFQENADDISTRAVGYFAASVGRRVGVVSWRTPPEPGLARERALADLRDAGWIFAGPGSPTYALRQWRGTPLPDVLVDAVTGGRVVVFASAAALTLGSHTVPVYEIYKAGLAPAWEPGLNLVEQVTGLPAVVIPHYDNAEGGHHDTRYCYLGERRLSGLERELPDEAFVLGVDEHTAVELDLAVGTATVVGNGRLTVRRHGSSVVYPSGSVLDLDDLAKGTGGAPARPAPATQEAAGPADDAPEGASLRADTDRTVAAFDAALAARDVDGCVAAILDLEQALLDWSADTLTSDEGDHARASLRRMVLRLGELATVGARDPAEVVGPYVQALLDLRARARAAGDYASSDWIRDRLGEVGVEVRDTPAGAEWHLH
jgi:cyanophycinase-like exopeptidase